MPDDSNDAIVSDASDANNKDDVIDSAIDATADSGKSYIDLAQDKNAQAGEAFQTATNTGDADQKNQLVEKANGYEKQADTILSNGNIIENAWISLKLWMNDKFWGTYVPVSHQVNSQVHSEQEIYNWAYDIARQKSRAEVVWWLNHFSKSSYQDLASKQMIYRALLDVYNGKARNPPGQPQQERAMSVKSQATTPTDVAGQVDAQQWQAFYIQTRRYATGLSWQQLNDQFYQHAVEAEAASPTLATQLQLKAYTHEIIARTRNGNTS